MTASCWSGSRSESPKCRRAASRCAPTTMPKSLKKRLDAYHAQTAPLSAYYRRKGLHKATDGMAPDRRGDGCDRTAAGSSATQEGGFDPQACGPRHAGTPSGRAQARRPLCAPQGSIEDGIQVRLKG